MKTQIIKNKGGSTIKTTYTLVYENAAGEQQRKTFRTRKQAEAYPAALEKKTAALQQPAKSSAQINHAIRHTGLKVFGTRGDGYFYFLDAVTDTVIKNSSVYVCYLSQLTLQSWIDEAEHIAKRLQEERAAAPAKIQQCPVCGLDHDTTQLFKLYDNDDCDYSTPCARCGAELRTVEGIIEALPGSLQEDKEKETGKPEAEKLSIKEAINRKGKDPAPAAAPAVETKISRNDGEYRVRLFVNGNYQAGSDYFTDDRQDAEDTAEAMKKHVRENGFHDTTKEDPVTIDKELQEIRAGETAAYAADKNPEAQQDWGDEETAAPAIDKELHRLRQQVLKQAATIEALQKLHREALQCIEAAKELISELREKHSAD